MKLLSRLAVNLFKYSSYSHCLEIAFSSMPRGSLLPFGLLCILLAWSVNGLGEMADRDGQGKDALCGECLEELSRSHANLPAFRCRYRLLEQSPASSGKTYECEFVHHRGRFRFNREDLEGKDSIQVSFDGRRYYRLNSRFQHGLITHENALFLEDHALLSLIVWVGPLPVTELLNSENSRARPLTQSELRFELLSPERSTRRVKMTCTDTIVQATEFLYAKSDQELPDTLVRTIQVTLDRERNYGVSRVEIEWGTPFLNAGFRHWKYQMTVLEFHQVREYALPCRASIQLIEAPRWGSREWNILMAAAPTDYVLYDLPSDFSLRFPAGTRVSDRILNTSYVISEHALK